MRKYQTNLNNMITLRVKEELNKTKLFRSQKQDAKFHYDCKNFAMIAKFSLSLLNFRYHCENFAMPAKFSNLLLHPPAAFLIFCYYISVTVICLL